MKKRIPRYHVQVSPVREVSLLGSADLGFWREKLRGASLYPAQEGGRARLLIVAADMRFFGLEAREVSLSVFVSRTDGGAGRDGAYLLHAFTSVRFFAFVERTYFRTPYRHARVDVNVGFPASFLAATPGGAAIRAAMGEDVDFSPLRAGPDGWHGPVFLPRRSPRGKDAERVFFASLEGGTQTHKFQEGEDRVMIYPSSEAPALAWLLESGFRGEEWATRASATHRRSKTVRRSAVEWP